MNWVAWSRLNHAVPNDCRLDTSVAENSSEQGASVYSNGDNGAAMLLNNRLEPAHNDEMMETNCNVNVVPINHSLVGWYKYQVLLQEKSRLF